MLCCPRCGAENDDGRAACWNCFAQLRPPPAGKPRQIEVKVPEPSPAPAPEVEAPREVEPAPEPPEEIESVEPETEGFVLDLDEPASAIGGPIPGLAEPEVEPAPDEAGEKPAGPQILEATGRPYAGAESPVGPPVSERRGAREQRRGARRFAVVIPIAVALVVGLAVAWWFPAANLSPVPTAREYVGAVATFRVAPFRIVTLRVTI